MENSKIDFWNGSEWKITDENYFEGVANLKFAEKIKQVTNNKVEVQYRNGISIYYTNINGTYGFPTILK